MSEKKKKKSVKNKRISKKRRRNIMIFIVTFVVLLVGVIWYSYIYRSLVIKNQNKAKELATLEEELKEKKGELNTKNMEAIYYQSDSSIQKIAREELGLVMPQEIVFIQSN